MIVIVCAAIGFPTQVSAQDYPARPMRMLVGFPPGGPTDITARITAEYLSGALGRQVIVNNRPRQGEHWARRYPRANPYDYTIGLCANGEMAISPNLCAKLPYDPVKDFAPVSRVGAAHLALVVHPSFAPKSVRELIDLAKSKPGTINFATSGTGSTSHLALPTIGETVPDYELTSWYGIFAPEGTSKEIITRLHGENRGHGEERAGS